MIDWKPFSPKQLDFIRNSHARLCIADGAVRSGKTIACNVRWLQYLATGPKGDLCMMGKTRDTLQRNVLNTLFDIVGDENYHWENKQAGELTLLGRRCYCFGAANEEAESKIRGATFAGALCDEANLYPRNVFVQLLARLSVDGAQCFLNCNPDSPLHYLYTDYIRNPKVTNKQRWKFLMDDNYSLGPAYIASLKQEYSGVWYDRMILGKWVAAEGLIYDMFDPKKHVAINAMQFLAEVNPNAITWLVACDYGTSSVMSWGLYAVAPDGRVVKKKEYYYDARLMHKQKTDFQFVEDFKHWLQGEPYPWTVYCDPSASSWKQSLRDAGYRVADARNDVINGIRYVGTMLNTNHYLIDATCVNTIREYQTYVWDDKAQAVGVDKPLKQNDHACVVGETEVWTTKGKKRIRDLVGKEGECWCYDTEANKFVHREFFNVQPTRFNAEVFDLILTDGRHIVATADHKVCTASGWKAIGELTQDDCVGVIDSGVSGVQRSSILQKFYNWLLGKSKRRPT